MWTILIMLANLTTVNNVGEYSFTPITKLWTMLIMTVNSIKQMLMLWKTKKWEKEWIIKPVFLKGPDCLCPHCCSCCCWPPSLWSPCPIPRCPSWEASPSAICLHIRSCWWLFQEQLPEVWDSGCWGQSCWIFHHCSSRWQNPDHHLHCWPLQWICCWGDLWRYCCLSPRACSWIWPCCPSLQSCSCPCLPCLSGWRIFITIYPK